MRYLVVIASDDSDWESADKARRQYYFDAHHAFEAFLREHGSTHGSAALGGPDLATTVRHVDGEPVVTDGPFAELAEHLSGYYDVELPDLDTAIAAAKLLPDSYVVEIRPVVGVEGYESG